MNLYSHEAEVSILGTLLQNHEMSEEILSSLVPEDFFKSEHKQVFSVIRKVSQSKKSIDLVSVNEIIKKSGAGVSSLELASIANNYSVNIAGQIGIIKDYAQARQFHKVLREFTLEVEENKFQGIEGIIDKFEKEFSRLSIGNKDNSLQTCGEILLSHIDKIFERKNRKGITGLQTSIKKLDAMTAGFQKSNLIILAARPSMGKTSYALEVARDNANLGKKCLFFSMEMSREQISEKLLIQEAALDGQLVRIGAIDSILPQLTYGAERVYKQQIFIDDSFDLDIVKIKSRARKIWRQHRLDLIVIDYLQLIPTKGNNRNLELAEITRQLKILAKELNVPIILLSQLNRGVESRPNKRPTLGDLRDSGAIEQDADLILFLYRDEYYNKNPQNQGLAEIILAKQREGPVGVVECLFNSKTTVFSDQFKIGGTRSA